MLLAFALTFAAALGGAPHTVRVGVLGRLAPQAVRVTSAAPFSASCSPGAATRGLRVERSGDLLAVLGERGERWVGRRIDVTPGDAPLRLEVSGRDRRERTFRSPVAVCAGAGRLVVVATVPLDSLVASGVRAELAGVRDPAALEAAAVVVRSFLISEAPRHADEGFDVCDTTHCFHSQGDADAPDAADRAASATAGQVLVRNRRAVTGYLTGACGGGTTTPSALWGGADTGDYAAVACRACARSPLYRWTRRLAAADVTAALSAASRETVRGRPRLGAEAGPNGWVRSVTVEGGPVVNGDAFRIALGRRLGWDALPSSRFEVAPAPGGYRFSGGGHGHGIGLCLAGAAAMARGGAPAAEILRRYFPAETVARQERAGLP